mmetsp:Transcript_16742/g.39781  ORF Transcript_16742/g.39781 Transcript_16742/m.39781 type:complete len:314 (-) Transcript_16742:127-1068(-)
MSAVRVCGSANFKGCFSFKPAPPRRLRFQPCRIAEKNTPSEGLENSVEGTKSPKKEDVISEVLGEDVHKALERSGGQEIHLSQGSFESLDSRLHQLLPDHSPGEFPDTHLHPSGWAGSTEDEEPDFDPLRDGPLRYLGYANELGEAFGAWLPPGGVPLSYGIAISYVLVDTYDKGMAAKRESAEQLERKSAAIPESVDRERLSSILAAERALDTVVWQLLASVIFPGFTIHQVVAATHSFLHPHLEHLTPREMEQMSAMAGYLHFGTWVNACGRPTRKNTFWACCLLSCQLVPPPLWEGPDACAPQELPHQHC